MIRKILIVVTVSLITAIVSCNVLLPERFAINAPVGSMLFGSSNPAPSSDIIDERFQVPAGFGLSLFAKFIDQFLKRMGVEVTVIEPPSVPAPWCSAR